MAYNSPDHYLDGGFRDYKTNDMWAAGVIFIEFLVKEDFIDAYDVRYGEEF